MIVVSNTTPIIFLASIGKLEILKKIFREIVVPEAVYREIKSKKGFGYREIDLDLFKVMSVKGKFYNKLLSNQLDAGEIETMQLAKELKAHFVIIDENMAYSLAKKSGLNVIRTLSILLKAKEDGIVKEIKPLLDEMILKGKWYSKKVYLNFLRRIGEV